jgi:SAM-dependent methyltransferase
LKAIPLQAYVAPVCRPSTLDSFGNRRLILAAVQRALAEFAGTVLDVGCGEKPYKGLLLAAPSRATRYVGLDLPAHSAEPPDIEWDGETVPLPDRSVDSVMLTEVLEHCPDAEAVLKEVCRVLRPDGFLFVTVPFIWPIHDVPHDEYRYTPFALRRILERAGFPDPTIEATGGRHAVLAVTLGLWVRRRARTSRVHVVTRSVLSILLWPVIWLLMRMDKRPEQLEESTLVVGLSVCARKPL